MADIMETNTSFNEKKIYKYISPSPLTNLLETTSFNIDFAGRKFLFVGFDPTDNFNVKIHIITPSRHISLYPHFLKRIYTLMGNILSFILDPPQMKKESIFLNDKLVILSKMVYRGENMLVLNSRLHEGHRVLLNRLDLFTLQNLERSIFESVLRKTIIVRPNLLNQFEQVVNMLAVRDFKEVSDIKKMMSYINNIPDEDLTVFVSPNQTSFINQIKSFAVEQLSIRLLERMEKSKVSKPCDENDGPTVFSPPSTYFEDISSYYKQDSFISDSPEDEDETKLFISPSPSLQPGELNMTIDENDGPSRFDLYHGSTPSSPKKYRSGDYPIRCKTARELFMEFK